MEELIFSRTKLLMGDVALYRLRESRVAVFGLGGVGGYAVEVLARSGIGNLDLFDNDCVCPTNINRQIYALHSTVGRYKVDVAEERILDINPNCTVRKQAIFYLPTNADSIDLSVYDYVLDCIDTIAAKTELVCRAAEVGTPIISCMGAAKKMDATAFRVTDIYETKVDPMAKVLRKKLREKGIEKLKVVYSEEVPSKQHKDTPFAGESTNEEMTKIGTKRKFLASNAFVPAVAGLIMGGEVVKYLIETNK